MIRVNLACGDDRRPGWLNVDQYTPADRQMDVRNLEFADDTIDQVLISHALEHMTENEVPRVLAECRRVLHPSGRLLVNVPDLPWVLENWLNVPEELKWSWPLATVFGLQDNPGEFHRTGFTVARLETLLRAAGFNDISVKQFFSHGQGCLWAQASPTSLGTTPSLSVLWSPDSAEVVQATLPQLAAIFPDNVFPDNAELIITERWGSASELLAQLEGSVTWLRNTDAITEQDGLAQGAMIASSERVLPIRAGRLVSMVDVVERASLAKRIAPAGFVPPVCLPAGHPPRPILVPQAIGAPTPLAPVITPAPAVPNAAPLTPVATSARTASTASQLSVVMNVRNEEHLLAQAIASVAGADHLIVGDMESTDRTVEIATQAGAQIVALPNAGFCEPGRQVLIDASTGEWVLILDGDERLSAGGLDKLRRLIENTPPEVAAYNLPFHTYVGDTRMHATGWDAHFELHPRLLRRTAVNWPTTIHAVPQFSGAVAMLPSDVDVWVEHRAFADVEHAFAKFNRYSTAEAQDLVAGGQPISILSGLGEGIAEFVRRYNPEVDNAASFTMSFGLLSYKFLNHAKALELQGWPTDPLLPSAQSMKQAWIAFLESLQTTEATRIHAENQSANRTLTPQARLEQLQWTIAAHGESADLYADIAAAYAELGDFASAVIACEQALQLVPDHGQTSQVLRELEARLTNSIS